MTAEGSPAGTGLYMWDHIRWTVPGTVTRDRVGAVIAAGPPIGG